MHSQTIVILDFGSQTTQLIARRIREQKVYSEIHPYTLSLERLKELRPAGIILSGGPCSVPDEDAPKCDPDLFELGIPILGICYGEQTICAQLGGDVESSDHREFGRAMVDVVKANPLFDGVWAPGERHQVWMSHGDRVNAIPEGFEVIATSEGAPFAAIADELRSSVAGSAAQAAAVHLHRQS